jgi:hypothetical protein
MQVSSGSVLPDDSDSPRQTVARVPGIRENVLYKAHIFATDFATELDEPPTDSSHLD